MCRQKITVTQTSVNMGIVKALVMDINVIVIMDTPDTTVKVRNLAITHAYVYKACP